jgi:hypothetical protein
MQNSDPACSRRRLLVIAPAALAALAVGCAKKEPESCDSTMGLTQEEIKTRKSLGYADRSKDPAKHCIECEQYLPPPEKDECGTCKVMKGPVHTQGSCNVFTPKR